jgi:hypothetical protein
VNFSDGIEPEKVMISIHDLSGKRINTFVQSYKTKEYLASELNMSAGVYFVTAKIDNIISSQKLVIQ